MSLINTIMQRQSVRKFKKEPVSMKDLKTIITAAGQAPSAKNIQNWHYIVVTNKEKCHELAGIVEEKNSAIAIRLQDEGMKKRFTKFLRFGTFFKDAPAVVFAFAKDAYVPTGLEELKTTQGSIDEIGQLQRTNPAMQSIGASIQNLLLAATGLGYGACWMTSPNYAAREIADALDFHKDGYALVATIPLGIIDGEAKSPTRKPIHEIATFID